MGVYKMIDERANALLKGVAGATYYARLAGDLARILGKPTLLAVLGAGAAKVTWDHREWLSRYIHTYVSL